MITKHQNDGLFILILEIVDQIFKSLIGFFDQSQIFLSCLDLNLMNRTQIFAGIAELDLICQILIFFAVASVVLHRYFKCKQWTAFLFFFIKLDQLVKSRLIIHPTTQQRCIRKVSGIPEILAVKAKILINFVPVPSG